MNKKAVVYFCVAIALSFALVAVSNAADEKTGNQAPSFWQKLFNYPANVTKGSVDTVAEAAKSGAGVVTDEVKTIGQVTSGDVDKSGELVTGPVKGTADTVVKATEDTVKVPVDAAKE